MTVITTAIGGVGTSIWKPEYRVEITACGLLVAFLIILGLRVQKHKNMRATEEKWLEKLSSQESKSIRAKSARHLMKTAARLDPSPVIGWAANPLSYLNTDVEAALDLIDGACREESEGMIDKPEFRGKFYPLVHVYWTALHESIAETQKQNPERWKYIVPVCEKYNTIAGVNEMDFYEMCLFLNKEAFLDGNQK